MSGHHLFLVGCNGSSFTIHRLQELADQAAEHCARRGNPWRWKSPPLDSADEVRLRMFILRDSLEADGFTEHEDGWHLSERHAVLFALAALKSMASKPKLPNFGKGLAAFRAALGFEVPTMAAMLGMSRTKVWRIESGEAQLSMSDLYVLQHWAQRLDRMSELSQAFQAEDKK